MSAILQARDAYRVDQLRARGIHPIVNEVIVVEGDDVKTCTRRNSETGLRCLQLHDHGGSHDFRLEMPGWKEKLMSKIDAEDGAKLVQALVRTFKNTEIDEEELQNAPAKLWDQFKTESANLGLDLKQIAERVRRGK